ncbi:response regulator [Oculatella sp. LEGE 06141]|uniref:hybrid sensor histidine kinase/response regulator n=1 Tax=Oculatella sp. LEGE 06141 TaxID=1828648 RepID=UPI0018823D66|nr:response regulator [Oculatella sp. LEGE 06141]MBE9177579.1 response regulator [Oculatella sp. LEGE 06141]
MKILVVEDQEFVREGILEILRLEHFQVLGAENGQVGVRLAREWQPDVILCDVVMPELDGHGVLAVLRQTPETATIPFIFLTAKGGKGALRHGMTLGADDYLTKPFTKAELLESIATQWGKRAAIEQQTQRKLDDLRNSIAFSLPHELHTPLAGIIGLSELMMADYGSIPVAEGVEMLQSIHTSAEVLYRLTQNFLLYAELELIAANPDRTASWRCHYDWVSVNNVLSNTARHIAKKAGREGDLHLKLQNAKIQIAENQFNKIAEELIGNAFKFSMHGTPVVVITHVGQSAFKLCVVNWGRGFSQEQIASVGAYMQFERKLYEQQGSGLGLVIARRLAELYGGNLTIESIPNRQTTVSVTLPL